MIRTVIISLSYGHKIDWQTGTPTVIYTTQQMTRDIVIGEAIKKAAGNRKGIWRYSSTLMEMDETLSGVSRQESQ
jgi:Imidazoleglycerol-phosphate dehydratase